MLGRQREVAVVTALLDRAAAGSGAALLLHGEPGIGKTTLLAEAQRLAARREMKTLTCSGVRAEARVPFAGLHQLLRPVLGLVAGLPGEQRDLLRAALGLDEHVLADLYRVALAALELLAVAAAQVPVLVVADDAHWLDRASADVLAFAARRIAAEPIAMVFSRRDGADNPFEWSGIPGLAVGALDADTSRSLLDRVAPQLPDEVRDRLLADAAGNPLALTELPATLRPDEPLPERLPVGDLLRQSFTTRLSELPARTQTLLLVVAADAGCRLGELCAAATIVYGSPVHEADIQPAIDARLVRLPGDKVAFCHPLIASAIYQSATVGGRQQVHTALAQVIPDTDDRRVWHLAAAALGPDDSVARELEALADRAARRGAVAVAIAALDRASSLVSDKAREAELLLRASESAVELGRGRPALDLASRADVRQLEPFGEARMLILREAVSPGVTGGGVAVADFIEAARAVAAAGDEDLAASALWTAATRCWWTSADLGDRRAVVAATQALDLPVTDPRRIAILSYTVTADRRPELRGQLLQACAARPDLTGLRFVASAAANLGDHALAVRLFGTAVTLARRQGRLGLIARLQALQAWSALWSGHLDAAAMLADETGRLAGEQNQPMWHGAAMLELALVRALRGDYPPAKEELWPRLAGEGNRDVRLFRAMAIYALSVAALGVGRYAEAYEYLRRIVDPADDFFHYGARQWVVGDLAAGAADCAAGGAGTVKPADRHAAFPLPPHRGLAPLPPVSQARHHHPVAACGLSGRRGWARWRRDELSGSGGPGHSHLAEQGPVILRDFHVDDPRRLSEVRRQRLLGLLEVIGMDVRGAGLVVTERLDQDVLVRVGEAARPVEPHAAGLVPGRLGEVGSDLRPLIGILGPDLELGRNKDHQSSLAGRISTNDPAVPARDVK